MISIYTVYIFAFVLIFIIIFVTRLIYVRTYNTKDVFLQCSLFFDKISQDNDVAEGCAIRTDDFLKIKKSLDNFLRYLNNSGYVKSKFFVMNKDNCSFYDVHQRFKSCNDYGKSKDPDCKKCFNFWSSFRYDPGVLLENNLIKRQGKNEVILYKTYNCPNEETFIIGVLCQEKY